MIKNFKIIFNSFKKKIILIKSNYFIFRNLDRPFFLNKSYEVSSFLFSTATGLYLFDKNKIFQLLNGRFFGITRYKTNIFFVYQQFSSFGVIRKIWLSNSKVIKIETFKSELSKNIHQICFFDSNLFICDTSNNRLLKINENGKIVKNIYPAGKLMMGKKSDNYCHFNSIFPNKDSIYLIAHNYSQYSSKNSQVFILNRNSYELKEVVNLDAKCAHNYILNNDDVFICDSENGNILINLNEKLTLGYFLRGFACDESNFIVGGSMYGKRSERIGKNCFIFTYDKKFNFKNKLKLKNIGPIFDIRFLKNDLGDPYE